MSGKETVRKKDVLWAIFLLLLSAIYLWQMRPCSICLEGACEEVCLIDKQTGCVYKIVVTDPSLQPSQDMSEPETFSFLHFGELIGYRDTVKKSVHLYIPEETGILKRQYFCNACCRQLADTQQRYAIADLRDSTAPRLYTLIPDAVYTIRKHEVTVSSAGEKYEITIMQQERFTNRLFDK